MNNQLHPADRACYACAEPLSIHYEGDRCLRCVHSYKLQRMNPLQQRVATAQKTAALLANVPRFEIARVDG